VNSEKVRSSGGFYDHKENYQRLPFVKEAGSAKPRLRDCNAELTKFAPLLFNMKLRQHKTAADIRGGSLYFTAFIALLRSL
jgi:hypothetical protein